jgi:hypothetical protein
VELRRNYARTFCPSKNKEEVMKRSIVLKAALKSLAVLVLLSGLSPISEAQLNEDNPRPIVLQPPTGATPNGPRGSVLVFPAFPDDHPQFPGFPPGIDYDVQSVVCREPLRTGQPLAVASRQFYTLYLTIGIGSRIRLASFNTDCHGNFRGNVVMTEPTEGLFSEDLVLEIFLESDDGEDAPDSLPGVLILRGEDSLFD